MTRQLVTQAEYARIRGVARNSVSKAAKAGRITLVDGKVDVDAANISWAARTDSTQQHRGAPAEFAKTQTVARASAARRASGAPAAPSPPAVPQDLGFGLSLVEEKTRAERLRIRKAELELEQMEGLSVSREAVIAALSTKLIAAAETLQSIPDRFAALFATETDANAIHRVLAGEIRAAMAAIATVPDALH